MYEVNWSNIIRDITPPRIYKKGIVAWISVLVTSVQNVWSWFKSFTDDTDYDLKHNGQVVYLEAALNDAFDPSGRGIYITNSGGNEIIPLFPDNDLKELELQPDSDFSNMVTLFPDSEYEGGEYDFIVNVPFALTQGETYRMQSILDKYKLASKRYYIKTQ